MKKICFFILVLSSFACRPKTQGIVQSSNDGYSSSDDVLRVALKHIDEAKNNTLSGDGGNTHYALTESNESTLNSAVEHQEEEFELYRGEKLELNAKECDSNFSEMKKWEQKSFSSLREALSGAGKSALEKAGYVCTETKLDKAKFNLSCEKFVASAGQKDSSGKAVEIVKDYKTSVSLIGSGNDQEINIDFVYKFNFVSSKNSIPYKGDFAFNVSSDSVAKKMTANVDLLIDKNSEASLGMNIVSRLDGANSNQGMRFVSAISAAGRSDGKWGPAARGFVSMSVPEVSKNMLQLLVYLPQRTSSDYQKIEGKIESKAGWIQTRCFLTTEAGKITSEIPNDPMPKLKWN